MNIKDLLSEYLEKNNIKLGNLEKRILIYIYNIGEASQYCIFQNSDSRITLDYINNILHDLLRNNLLIVRYVKPHLIINKQLDPVELIHFDDIAIYRINEDVINGNLKINTYTLLSPQSEEIVKLDYKSKINLCYGHSVKLHMKDKHGKVFSLNGNIARREIPKEYSELMENKFYSHVIIPLGSDTKHKNFLDKTEIINSGKSYIEKSSNLYFENEPFYYLVLFLRNEYIFQNNPEII